MKHILETKTIHASGVCFEKKGVLILGKSGSGKSSLALSLVANGAQLVCDDRAQLRMKNKILMMTKPPSLPGALEVRGLGLISVPAITEARVELIIDMALTSDSRLGGHKMELFGVEIPCVKGKNFYGLSDAIIVWSKYGGFLDL